MAQADAFGAALGGATAWRQLETGDLELTGHGDLIAAPGVAAAAERCRAAGGPAGHRLAARRPRWLGRLRRGAGARPDLRRRRDAGRLRRLQHLQRLVHARRREHRHRTPGRDQDGLSAPGLGHRGGLSPGARRRRPLGDPAVRPARPERPAGPDLRARASPCVWLTSASVTLPPAAPWRLAAALDADGPALARPGAARDVAPSRADPTPRARRASCTASPLTTLDDHLAPGPAGRGAGRPRRGLRGPRRG